MHLAAKIVSHSLLRLVRPLLSHQRFSAGIKIFILDLGHLSVTLCWPACPHRHRLHSSLHQHCCPAGITSLSLAPSFLALTTASGKAPSQARGTFEVRSLKKTPHLYWFCFALHSSPFLSLGQNFLAVTRERAAQQTRITS